MLKRLELEYPSRSSIMRDIKTLLSREDYLSIEEKAVYEYTLHRLESIDNKIYITHDRIFDSLD